MKLINIFKITLFSISALLITSCSNSDELDSVTIDEPLVVLKVAQEDGASMFINANICPVLDITDPLTADEIEFLYAMREDEKIARDLYTAFALQYPANTIFNRIAQAETTHIAAIETLFEYYEVDYPVLEQPGIFTDPNRQAVYNELLTKGSTLQGALEAMARVEEENVAVYSTVIENLNNINLKLLVSNMQRASCNHLKAGVRQLTALGVTYNPVVLDQITFDTIINSTFNQGNKYGQHAGQGNKRGNTNSQKRNQGGSNKGNVNNAGTCTYTVNGVSPGTNDGQGKIGKNYKERT